jgi:hypothetical protein
MSLLGGLAAGATLGALGNLLPGSARGAVASLLALLAIGIGVYELAGQRLPVMQCDRETPQRWIHQGPLGWAIRNGGALGCGAFTRLGFWLWYAVPTGAFLLANPFLSASLYGTYGIARGLSVWPIILVLGRWRKSRWPEWLLERAPAARTTAAAYLVLLGVAVAMAIGV